MNLSSIGRDPVSSTDHWTCW